MIINKNNQFPTAGYVFAVGVTVAAAWFTVMSTAARATDVTASHTVQLRADIEKICRLTDSFSSHLDFRLAEGQPAGSIFKESTSADITCNTAAGVELVSEMGAVVHRGIHVIGNETAIGNDVLTDFDYTARLTQSSEVLAQLNTADNDAILTEETSGVQTAFDIADISAGVTLDLEVEPEDVMGVLQSGKYIDNLTINIIPQ